MPLDGPIDYNWIEGVERLEMYKPGGYHPVMINDLLNARYRIVDKLGFGGYSTIWLAHDDRTKNYVAIKINISGSPVPRRETSILHALSDSRSISQVVHGDIHLRNVLVRLPSTYDDLSIEQFRERFAVLPLYLGKKAKEFTLADAQGLVLSDFRETQESTRSSVRAQYTTVIPSDIWSLGTAIWEILGMKFIFSESETKDEIVAQQIDVLGSQNFPSSWQKQWERPITEGMDIDEGGPRQPTGDRETWPHLDEAFEEFVQKHRRKRETFGTFGEEETKAILDLMRGMLKFRPEERLTIDEVLMSEWMVKWALPQLK